LTVVLVENVKIKLKFLLIFLLDYCRKIEFDDNFTIDDSEYIQIFERSFWFEIKSEFLNNCLICNQLKPREDIYILNQTETYCNECIMKEVNTRTNNYIILNEYEKSKKNN